MNRITDITIASSSFLSLHAQLHQQLRHLILSGRWKAGSRIPSESDFVRFLKISRSTVRLALQQAEVEGLIKRFPGKGAFVAQHKAPISEHRLISFVTHHFDTETMLLMLRGAESEARARDYKIVLSHVENQQEEIDTLRRLHQENIAGILIWPDAHASRPDPANARFYQEITLPMVVMDRMIYGADCDCITSDHYGGACALMQYLVELGHKNIVFVTHQQQDLLSVQERYRAYVTVLRENGLPLADPWVIGQPGVEIRANYALRSSIGFTSPELQQLKEYMLAAEPTPTAIFALNDYMALMAMQAMKRLDLAVPETVSIAGFDDIDLAAHLEVPLTTVAQDPFLIGKRAAHQLFERLEGYVGPSIRENIPVQLRIRHSTTVPLKAVSSKTNP